MEQVKLIYQNGGYDCKEATSDAMDTLGLFFSDDCYNPSSFKDYIFNDWEIYTNSNATALEKKDGYVLLSDMHSEEEIPTVLRMTQGQFIKLLDDWQEKVLNLKPKEAIITYENDQFILETSD
jgi:hypothetical protein